MARQTTLHCCACVIHVGMCGTRVCVWSLQGVDGAMHDKLNRGLRTPWSVVLSDNVGVGPLVALQYWLRIIPGHPPARSEYRHLGAVHD